MITDPFRATIHLCSLCVLVSLTSWAFGATPDVTAISPDLITPKVVSGDPMPARRVFRTLPGYEESNVRHALYLPTDWIEGETYPVIAEFTGNDGTVASGRASQGYGISGGEGYIWVTLPFVSEDGRKDMDWWWGDPDRTADYAKAAVELVCEQWGRKSKGCHSYRLFSRCDRLQLHRIAR